MRRTTLAAACPKRGRPADPARSFRIETRPATAPTTKPSDSSMMLAVNPRRPCRPIASRSPMSNSAPTENCLPPPAGRPRGSAKSASSDPGIRRPAHLHAPYHARHALPRRRACPRRQVPCTFERPRRGAVLFHPRRSIGRAKPTRSAELHSDWVQQVASPTAPMANGSSTGGHATKRIQRSPPPTPAGSWRRSTCPPTW